MSKQPQEPVRPTPDVIPEPQLPPRRKGFKLFRRIFLYHLVLAVLLIALALMFPGFIAELPIGGVTELAESGDVSFSQVDEIQPAPEDIEIVTTFINATSEFDRLGYARKLMMVLLGVWLLMLPVSWVHKGIHRVTAHDHSLDETTLILPGVVAGIVTVVQYSLALAFSLAGIVAGVQFRRALQDTFDALFILVAIGAGIAAGVQALEIAAVLTVFFCYATLYVYFFGDGLESDYKTQKKAIKAMQQQEAAKKAAET